MGIQKFLFLILAIVLYFYNNIKYLILFKKIIFNLLKEMTIEPSWKLNKNIFVTYTEMNALLSRTRVLVALLLSSMWFRGAVTQGF